MVFYVWTRISNTPGEVIRTYANAPGAQGGRRDEPGLQREVNEDRFHCDARGACSWSSTASVARLPGQGGRHRPDDAPGADGRETGPIVDR